MNNIRLLFISTAAILALGCSRDLPEPPAAAPDEAIEKELSIIPGILNVEFTEDMAAHIESATDKELTAEMSPYGITSIRRMFPDAGEFEARHREFGLHRWYKVSYDPAIPATKAAADFSEIPGAATVEIPRRIHSTGTYPFNDPYANEQWNLYNTAQLNGFVKGVDINVIPLWEITGGSKDVIVNVVDTGIDMNHAELRGVCIAGGSNGSRNFVPGLGPTTITGDKHGTHVAGTIAAISNNGIGISGIAGGKDGKGGVRILSSQVFHEKDDDTEEEGDTEAGIVWGADHGALISQNSWGYNYDNEKQAKADRVPQSFKSAVDYFIKYAGCDAQGNQTGLMKGGLVTFAAGNDGWSIGHPGDYEPVIAVGALGPDGRRATYSNYGGWVDICAPGGEFDRFDDPIAMILGPAGGDYYYMAGTSMACPHVSGVAALLISALGGPGFTCEDLKRILTGGANYSYGVSEQIGPALDAYGAYQAFIGDTGPEIRTDYTGDYRIKGHEVLGVNFFVTCKGNATIDINCDNSATYSIHDKTIVVSFNDGSGTMSGSHRLTITAKDSKGQSATKTVDYIILQNHAPVVISPIEDKVVSVMASVTPINLGNVFMDEDGGELSYSININPANIFQSTVSGENLSLTSLSNGVTDITVTATDPCGLSCSCSFRAGMFDGKNGPALYPNPVDTYLNICPAGISDIRIEIYNTSGKKLFSGSANASVLDPCRVDMTGFAPGRYRVVVSYGGQTYNKDIVKL